MEHIVKRLHRTDIACLIVGDAQDAHRRTRDADNVEFAGYLLADALPAKLAAFDIGVVPDPPNAANVTMSMIKAARERMRRCGRERARGEFQWEVEKVPSSPPMRDWRRGTHDNAARSALRMRGNTSRYRCSHENTSWSAFMDAVLDIGGVGFASENGIHPNRRRTRCRSNRSMGRCKTLGSIVDLQGRKQA
jgi:hypothetical protein